MINLHKLMECSRTLWHTRNNERYAQRVEPTMSYYDYSNATYELTQHYVNHIHSYIQTTILMTQTYPGIYA